MPLLSPTYRHSWTIHSSKINNKYNNNNYFLSNDVVFYVMEEVLDLFKIALFADAIVKVYLV